MNNKSCYTKEDAYQTLNLINEWTRSSDTKTSILMAFISILFGFTLTAFDAITYIKNSDNITFFFFFIVILIILYIIFAAASVVFCCMSLYARLKYKNLKSNSIFYFGDIAKQDERDFIMKTSEVTEDNIVNDLKLQIAINSRIAKCKLKYFNYGLISSIVLFFCAIILLVIVYSVL